MKEPKVVGGNSVFGYGMNIQSSNEYRNGDVKYIPDGDGDEDNKWGWGLEI